MPSRVRGLHGPQRATPSSVRDLRLRRARRSTWKLDHLALLVRQALQRGADGTAFLGEPELDPRRRRRGRAGPPGPRAGTPLRRRWDLLAAHGVDGAVMDHAHQPRADRTPRCGSYPPGFLHTAKNASCTISSARNGLPNDAARERHRARRGSARRALGTLPRPRGGSAERDPGLGLRRGRPSRTPSSATRGHRAPRGPKREPPPFRAVRSSSGIRSTGRARIAAARSGRDVLMELGGLRGTRRRGDAACGGRPRRSAP